MFVVYFGVFGAILQLHSNFSVIFMQGGSGKNGSTVAVSTADWALPCDENAHACMLLHIMSNEACWKTFVLCSNQVGEPIQQKIFDVWVKIYNINAVVYYLYD